MQSEYYTGKADALNELHGKVKTVRRFEDRLKSAIEKIFIAGAVVLFIMMMLTVSDVVGRYFFGKPIMGVDELVGLSLVCLVAVSLAYCQLQKGHIRIELLNEHLPSKAQVALDVVAYLFSLSGACLISWQTLDRAMAYLFATRGQMTQIMGIPYFPFVLVLGLGFFLLAIASLIDFINSIVKVLKN
jgi:TRAP-type C4-dicarboxylate transport system permease small subunit